MRALKPVPSPSTRRRYPRDPVQLKAEVSIPGAKGARFRATLNSVDLSVGGIFLESTFFLKLGQVVEVSLRLPRSNRRVRAKGLIVRVEQLSRDGKRARTGFAVKFHEYLDGSDVILANHFLAPVLRGFVEEHARNHDVEADEQYIEHVVDVLAAWELRKAGEVDPTLWGEP